MLVLIIVYATNFFKDFFFEAIVTVNLTSLLVLTTLFISVSSSLPQTVERQSDLLRIEIYILSQAYVKMVDVWLIFAQVVPWIEVLPPHSDHHHHHLDHYQHNQHQYHPHRHHQHHDQGAPPHSDRLDEDGGGVRQGGRLSFS